MGLGIGIRTGVEWRSELKLVYRLKITFEIEVYVLGSGDAGLVRKYSQLNLTFF